MSCEALPALTLQRATTLSKAYSYSTQRPVFPEGCHDVVVVVDELGLGERGVAFMRGNLAVFEPLAPHVRGTIVCL